MRTPVGLNAALIPVAGALGAAVATFLAAALFFGVWLAASQRLYRLPLRGGALAMAIALFLILAATGGVLDARWPVGSVATGVKLLLLLAFVAAGFALGLVRPGGRRAALGAKV